MAGVVVAAGFCVAGIIFVALGLSDTFDVVLFFTVTIQVYFFFPAFVAVFYGVADNIVDDTL